MTELRHATQNAESTQMNSLDDMSALLSGLVHKNSNISTSDARRFSYDPSKWDSEPVQAPDEHL